MQFESIIRENQGMIIKVCRIYSSANDYDDLYQEVLISIWKSQPSFKGNSKLSTWLYRVVLNTALSFKKQEVKKASWSLESAPKPFHVPIEFMEKDDEVERLYTAIKQLKPEERTIIFLYLEERKQKEIAEITGYTENNVAVKISRIKKRLFELLKETK